MSNPNSVNGFENKAYKSEINSLELNNSDSQQQKGEQQTNEQIDDFSKRIDESTNPEPNKIRNILKRLSNEKGSFIAILSAFFVSLGGIFYKKAITMSGSDNSILRYVCQFITMLAILKYKKIPVFGPKEQRKLLMLRAFFGIFAVVFANFGIKYIDPSDNIALSHTNVIITAIMAKIILKEKFTIFHFLSLIVTLGGVLLISKPGFIFHKETKSTFNDTICDNKQQYDYLQATGWYRALGVIFALIGALGSGALHIVIKKLCINKIHFAVTTLYGTFLGLPVSILISIILTATGTYHSNIKCELKYIGLDILFGMIGGALAILGHVTFNISLNYEDATKVAILRTIDVLFSFILQFIILKINTDYISILGAIAILFGTLIILTAKYFKAKCHKVKCCKAKKNSKSNAST